MALSYNFTENTTPFTTRIPFKKNIVCMHNILMIFVTLVL